MPVIRIQIRLLIWCRILPHILHMMENQKNLFIFLDFINSSVLTFSSASNVRIRIRNPATVVC